MVIVLGSNVCKVEDLVIYTCACTLATGEVFLQFSQHIGFIRSGEYEMSIVELLPSVSKAILLLVLNSELDSVVDKEAVESCKVLSMKLVAILSRRRIESWEALAGLLADQAFSVHIMHFVGNLYAEAALYRKC